MRISDWSSDVCSSDLQTLVLVNGKRRHRGATVQFTNVPYIRGSQGPDLSAIPSIAIGQLEVLRDGASALYGSDAIAGVLNFGLRRDREGGLLIARYGQFYKGDGEIGRASCRERVCQYV